MSVHLIKLCVGAEDIEDLRVWQTQRLAERVARNEPAEIYHITRMVPTRREELLEGGSLYWVIKGIVRCRQRLIDIRPFVDDEGIRRCRLVLDPELVATQRRARRPFQGWRYFDPADAPPDARAVAGGDDMPEALRTELESLGLL